MSQPAKRQPGVTPQAWASSRICNSHCSWPEAPVSPSRTPTCEPSLKALPITLAVAPVIAGYPYAPKRGLNNSLGQLSYDFAIFALGPVEISDFPQIANSDSSSPKELSMDRFILTDAQWETIEPHCLGKKTDPGRTGGDGRLFL